MNVFSLSLVIGAALASSFRSTFGEATRAVEGLGGAAGKLGQGDGRRGIGGTLAGIGSGIAGIVAAVGAGAAVGNALNFEAALMDVGITAKMTDEQLKALRGRILELSRTSHQSRDQLVEGFRALVVSGMDSGAALAALPAIAKTATAANADIRDLSETAVVLMRTLKVAPGDLAAELDRLAAAGDRGAFELKDMAREFPTLGANLAQLKIRGTDAVATLGAALQIVRQGAGSSSEAANNLLNLLNKITSEDAIRELQGFGVNVPRIISAALRSGENPFDAILEQINKVVLKFGGTDEGSRIAVLSKLFTDQQVRAALNVLLPNLREYRDLKADILKSEGTVDENFSRRISTSAAAAAHARDELGSLANALANILLPPLGSLARIATPALQILEEIAAGAPMTTAGIIGIGVAMKIMGAAFTSTPIGALIAGLVIGAGLLIDNWTTVRDFFIGIWEPVKPVWDAFIGMVTAAFESVRPVLQAIGLVPKGAAAPGGLSAQESAGALNAAGLAQSTAGTTSRVEAGGSVRVRFENAPRGMRAEVQRDSSDIGLDVSTGYVMAMP